MEVEEALAQKFLGTLRNCRHPCDSFQPNSKELKLAEAWFEYLIHYHCHNNADRRIRTSYLYGLSKCIEQKRMHGPFNHMPPPERLRYNGDKKKTSESSGSKVCVRCRASAANVISSEIRKLLEMPPCPCALCKPETKHQGTAKEALSSTSTFETAPVLEEEPIAIAVFEDEFADNDKEMKEDPISGLKKSAAYTDLQFAGASKNASVKELPILTEGPDRLEGGKEHNLNKHSSNDDEGVEEKLPNAKRSEKKCECVLAAYLKERRHRLFPLDLATPSIGPCSIQKTCDKATVKIHGNDVDMYLCTKVKYLCTTCEQVLTTVDFKYLEHNKDQTEEANGWQNCDVQEKDNPKNLNDIECSLNTANPETISTKTFVLESVNTNGSPSNTENKSKQKRVLKQFTKAFTVACEEGMTDECICNHKVSMQGSGPVAKAPTMAHKLVRANMPQPIVTTTFAKQKLMKALTAIRAPATVATRKGLSESSLVTEKTVYSDAISQCNSGTMPKPRRVDNMQKKFKRSSCPYCRDIAKNNKSSQTMDAIELVKHNSYANYMLEQMKQQMRETCGNTASVDALCKTSLASNVMKASETTVKSNPKSDGTIGVLSAFKNRNFQAKCSLATITTLTTSTFDLDCNQGMDAMALCENCVSAIFKNYVAGCCSQSVEKVTLCESCRRNGYIFNN